MKTIKTGIIVILYLLSIAANAQTKWTSLVYNADVKEIEYNPMKGLIPGYTGINSNFPYSTDHFYIDLKSVYKDWGKCDWTEFEKELNRIVEGGRHVVARVFVDYPGKPNLMPDFLLDNVGYKVPMHDENTPDWNNDTLMVALEDFISLFGKKYDGDPRILMIEAGIFGYWGEWHCYPETNWEMNQNNKDRIIVAYTKSFQKTHIALRQANHPSTKELALSVGYYDDSFCFQTLCNEGVWCFTYSIKDRGLTDCYKYHPMGGEIRPEIQSTLFNAWPNTVGEDIAKCVKETHMSINKAFFLYQEQPTPIQFENALKMHKMMGYQFHVSSVQIVPEENKKFSVNVNIQNRGVAPIYYNWQVEFSAIDSEGKQLGIIGSTDWNTHTIIPDSADYLRTYNGTLPSDGSFKILMRFKNPLDSYTTKARAIRFANSNQDADLNGWLTLGLVTIKK